MKTINKNKIDRTKKNNKNTNISNENSDMNFDNAKQKTILNKKNKNIQANNNVHKDLELKNDGKRKKMKGTKIAAIVCSVVIIFPLLLVALGFLGFEIYSSTMKIDLSLFPTSKELPIFYDNKGNIVPYIDNAYVEPDSVHSNLSNAFIAVEDKRFYKHKGYDFIRICGALITNLKAGKLLEGGSTITQQLIKNTHLTHDRTMDRKLKEIAIAKQVEKLYSKQEIMSMYLSVIYFGAGAYGINSASELYFAKTPSELTLSECATLAGIIKNPTRNSPKNSIVNSTERRNLVLSLMLSQDFISNDAYTQAIDEKIVLANEDDRKTSFDFYLKMVANEIENKFNITKHQLENSGYKVFTNLDMSIQNDLFSSAKNMSNFKESNTLNSSILIENNTGKIVAHYSNLNFEADRQLGSVAKPILVYAPALEENIINLATRIEDKRISIGGYSPSNYGDIYYGDTSIRKAIEKSMNSVALKTMNYLTVEKAIKYANKFNIPLSKGDDNLSLSLGATSKGASVRDIASAYTVFANKGKMIQPSYISHIVLEDKKIYSQNSSPTEVISSDNAYLMTSALMSTVKNGTAKGLSTLSYDVASKTGTVELNGKNTDAYNASYTSQHSLVVWHGKDDLKETGGGHTTRHTKNIWQSVYKSSDNYPTDFEVSSTIFESNIDLYSTSKNKKLTIASANTPDKYIESEIFSLSNIPDSNNSWFDRINQPNYEIKIINGKIQIELEIFDIYSYQIDRIDAIGRTTIYNNNSTSDFIDWDLRHYYTNMSKVNQSKSDNQTFYDDKTIITDNPIAFGDAVEYVFTIRLKEEQSNDFLSHISSKKVYIRSIFND